MKEYSQKLALILFKLLRAILLFIPEKAKIIIGKFIGIILMLLSKSRKNVTSNNISNSNLKLNNKKLSKIVKESYQSLGITLVELLTIDKYEFKSDKSKITFKNLDLIIKAKSRGNGVILLSGHYGNWELLAYSASKLLNETLNIVVKYQMNPFTDKYLRNLRQRGGNKLLDMKKAGIQLVKILKSNGIVAMLADQRAGKNEGIVLDFMGNLARAYKAPAVLALKFNTPIVIGFAVRNRTGNYEVELVELIHDDLDNNEDGIRELTKRYLDLLEKAIIQNPGHWAWQHNRWKLD
jgi:KDO2-lipid IV(A) lauroyltransferase